MKIPAICDILTEFQCSKKANHVWQKKKTSAENREEMRKETEQESEVIQELSNFVCTLSL